jgi:hypothetical protein
VFCDGGMCIGAVVTCPGGGGGGIGCVLVDCERCGAPGGGAGMPEFGGGGGAERIDWLGGAPDLNDADGGAANAEPLTAGCVCPSDANAPESDAPLPDGGGGPVTVAGAAAGICEDPRCVTGAGGGGGELMI